MKRTSSSIVGLGSRELDGTGDSCVERNDRGGKNDFGKETVSEYEQLNLVALRHFADQLELTPLGTLAPDSTEFGEVLDDIAEEFRVIHYQIANTRLFNYVVPG